MNQLALGWVEKKFTSEILQISTTDKKIQTSSYSKDGLYPVIDQGQEYISGYCNDLDKVIKIKSPVVIFGDHTRVFKYIDFDFVPGADGTKVLVPNEYFHPKFFYYLLRSIELPNKGYSRHFKYLKEILIKIAPINEQTRIVEKLDEVLAQVDTIKARLDGIPAILKRFRQSVLAAAVSGRLTEEWRAGNKSEWNSLPLKMLTSKIGSGSTPKGGQEAYKEEGIPFVRSMNIYSTYIKYDDLAFIDESQAEKLKNVTIERDDVLLNITGASIGRVNIAPDMFVGGRVNQHVSIIRCNKEQLQPTYLHIYVSSPLIQEWILGENYGATRQALTKDMIENLMIELPSICEQKEIVRVVDQYFAFADTIEAQVKKAQARVDNLTQSILAKAFRGELVAQDPDDEPAEKLLERIAQARKEAEALAKAAKKVAKTK